MAACVDALDYYKCKPYAQNIGQYSLSTGANALNRDRLSFYRNPSTNVIEDPFDLDYMTKLQAQTIWTSIRGWLDYIEGIYGIVDGNVTDGTATKGLKKLYTIDGYYHTDVVNLLTLLEDYYEYYDLVQLKTLIDGYIAQYQIPTEDHVDVSAGSYKFRDNNPDSENYVSDAQIDTLLGLFDGYVDTLSSDDTYSRKLKFYVFGNANFDEDPDTAYVETVRDYLDYEADRRGFVRELSPFVSHFTPLLYMNLGSLTVGQLQNHILEDQAMYEDYYNYTFVDSEGNQLVDSQNNPITVRSLGYSYQNDDGDWVNGTYGKYCYINVYSKYYNTANTTEPYSFNENPLARADFLQLIGTFNEDLQSYIYRLYAQLNVILTNRITDAMNATNDGDSNLEITLSNFSIIKTMLERALQFYTTLTDATYDENEVQTGVHMFDYLKNAGNNYASMYMNEGAAGFYSGASSYGAAFTDTQLHFTQSVSITTDTGTTWTLEDAYNKLKNCGLLAKVQEFVNSGGLANWAQEHYYNTSDGNATTGYKFTKPEAYMVRLPYAGDLGRGNNTVNNDTYTVTNKMVNDLVTQLDTFLGSEDMVAILSSLIKLGDEDTAMLTNMKLYEYVMKLLGEMLFTDKIINTLTNLIFPMITKMLEELWNGLDNKELTKILGVSITLKTISDGKTIYEIANGLGLAVYPDTLAANSLMQGSQLAAARSALASNAIKNSNGALRNVDWVNLLAAHHEEEDETKLNLDWGVDAVTKGENESYTAWFQRRANAFKTALSGVLGGLDKLIVAVFSGIDYSQNGAITDVAHLVVDASLKDLKIQGINGYSRIIVPVLEALGCSQDDIVAASAVRTTLTNTPKVVNAILDPIVNLVINDVATAPISTILTLLPNLLYFLSFNTLDQLVKDLKIYITDGRLYVDSIWPINQIDPSIAWILSLGVVSSNLPDGISSDGDKTTIELFKLLGKNSINELITAVDISDFNAILSLILESVIKDGGDLELPIIDVGSVLKHATLYETTNTAGSGYPARPYISTKAITSSGATYNRRYFRADNADMFYDIISWVAKAFQNDSFISQLVAMITKSNNQQDTLVKELLTGIRNSGPAHFVLGLVEVFQPKARAGVSGTSVWANTTYMPAQYTWYGTDSAQNDMQNMGVSKFLYVAYQNDWTYVKANTFVENADTIITKLLENQLREREINSFGEWLLSYINLAWSNEAITTVMRLLVTLGNATKNELISYIVGRFTENGMDLSEWYDAFGYLFPEIVEEDVETGETDPETGEPVTVKQMPEKLDPNNAAYTNVFTKLSVRANPDYEEDLNESGEDRNKNQKYIWTYDGTELVDAANAEGHAADRQTFQDILTYLLAGGSGTKGGMMPAINIFLSGDLGVLFPQQNNTSLLKIYGSNGYDSSIVPLFEALGMNELLKTEDFVGFAQSVGLTTNDFTTARRMLKQSEFDSIASEQLKVEYLFDVAFGFLEKIMEPEYVEKTNDDGTVVLDDNGQPVMEPVYNNLVKQLLTTVLPSLLYFLQSNGLSVAVRNLLQPVLTLVDALLPVFNINIDDGTARGGLNGTPLDGLLNELIGRFVLPLLGKAGDRQIAQDGEGNYLYETDSLGNPLKDADGNVIYIYDDDYGISLKDLSFHALANVIEKLTGLNMEPLVYGLDAICSTYSAEAVDSASEMSTDAHWTSTGARTSFKRYKFIATDPYYDVVKDPDTGVSTVTGNPRDVNDPANVITIILSMVLDLVLEETSKSPVRTAVTDDEGNPVYIKDQNGNTTTMIEYTYTVVDGEQQYYSNAEAVVNLIKVFTDAEIIDMIPMVVQALRDLGFTTAWTITPNWSYFDDIDRAEYDEEGNLIRTNRRTTAQLIAEAQTMFDATGYALVNTPVRTIYYLRYAENFAPNTNLWSRELATYLDTSLSDLVDWIMAEFVVKKEGATLGSYLEDLLTGEDGFINKGIVNTVNAALRDGIGSAIAKFAELLNIFLSFDINYWNEDPYPEAEADDPISLTQFGADLAKLFTPMNEILTWLLSGREMAFFHSYKTTGGYTEYVMDEADRVSNYGDLKDLLVLPGGQGYWVALVPLLEALGIRLPMNETGTAYKYMRDEKGRVYYMKDGAKKLADGIEILTDVVVAIVSQVDGWLKGEDPLGLGDNVIDCVLNRLANIIYFLNANGLVTVVVNLLSPLIPLANAIVPMIFSDLGIPEQGADEDDAAYETRKFIVLVDELLDEVLFTETTKTVIDPETGEEKEITEKKPILPESFSIVDLNLYNICEVIKDIAGIDINGAVTSTFYVNGEDDTDGTVTYNWLQNFFLGEISMRDSANGDKYFRMDFNDEESRADFITILLYTVMDVVNNAITPGTSNNEFFVNILGKTDEKDEDGNDIIDTALGQQKLNDLYNIIHAKVSGYEGYDWFYFDQQARDAYYAHTPETEYSATLQLKLQSILEAIANGGYQVDWNDTTMAYLLTGYLNYTDTNLWDEGTAKQVEARFYDILDLALSAILGDGNDDIGAYLTGLLEDFDLFTNKYIVMLGALLGDLLKNIPENVAELADAAVPGLDLTYWDQYTGKAVEDEEHPAGTFSEDGKTEYVPLVYYTDRTEFVDAFVSLLEPFGYLLDWLLVGEGKGLELFYVVDGVKNDTPAISIGGANGFTEGLVPLLEALGLTFNVADIYEIDSETGEVVREGGRAKLKADFSGVDAVRVTLNSLIGWVEGLLQAETTELVTKEVEQEDGSIATITEYVTKNNTVGAVIDLLPNLIYFINANGLTVTVLNTLRSLTNVLELASGLLSSSGNDISNLNTLLGLDKMGINLYDLSLEGIMGIVKHFTGIDILKSVSLPKLDDQGNVVTDDEGNVVYQDSYLKQWAIGKVQKNADSVLLDKVTYKMAYTYTREQVLAMYDSPAWNTLSTELKAQYMERINIFTILICSVLDVFKLEDNEEALRKLLGDQIYELIDGILNSIETEIHYEPFDWFYFDDAITGKVSETTASETNTWPNYFPEDGSEYVVKYIDSTPYSLIYKYGYFEYYRHDAGDTGNLWNKDSVGYLKDNFYYLIDTVIGIATDFDSAAAFIADAWNGVNLYSKSNLYSVGYTIGNLLSDFEGVLELVLNILLGVNISGNWDAYMKVRVTDKAELVGTEVKDDAGNVVKYKGAAVKYIADETMSRTDFINALVDIFKPADFLVSWFLVGADTPLEFMYTKYGDAAISLKGGNGYDEALVPILEALGCDLSDSAAYFAAAEGGKSGMNVVKYVADKLLGRVDAIAASENPVQQIVAMLPNLIYFINANGLSVAVRNLLQPVIALLGVVNGFIDTGDLGDITTLDELVAAILNMLKDQIDVDFDLTQISISDLSITGVFDLLKVILGVDVNAAMTFPRMTNDENGNAVVYHDAEGNVEMINIYEQLALGKVTRYTSANGKTAFRMDATDDPAALSQIDMIAILMATVVNLFTAKNGDDYINKAAFVKLFNGFAKEGEEPQGEAIYQAILDILNLQEGGYVDYDWLYTIRDGATHIPHVDPGYQGRYVSPLDRISSLSGTAGYDKYWTKEMAQYVADNLVKVVNNVLLLIGISIPGIEGPIESIDDLINGLIPGGNLYTNELLGKLVGLIVGTGEADDEGNVDKGLLGKLDEIDENGAIKGLLKNVLGIDLTKVEAYRGRTNYGFADGDRDGFVNALAEFLSPVNPLLEWLFTDKSISLFYNADASDLIKLPGGNGYEQAIIPLFEAVFGYENQHIKTLAEYKADIAANPNNMLVDILNPLLDFVDEALADPLNVILGRIPAIVYFINSKAADRMVKNLLSPVYQVLNALNTLVSIDIDEIIRGAIGFSLEELDFDAIIQLAIGALPDNLSSLKPLILDAVNELTIGMVVEYPSKATFHTDKGFTYTWGFTMVLDDGNGGSGSGGSSISSGNATLADLITILLRALIKWVTMPENQETVVNFLKDNIENETVRTYVLNAYGVNEETLGAIDTGLIGFRYQPYGISEMMALLYYVYFAVNLASSEAVSAVSKYGNYWPYAVRAITVAMGNGVVDLSFLSGFVSYMNGLVDRVNGQNGGNEGGNGNGSGYTPTTEDNDGGHGSIGNVVDDINSGKVDPSQSTSLNFFQRIIKWFQDLFAKIGKLFGR